MHILFFEIKLYSLGFLAHCLMYSYSSYFDTSRFDVAIFTYVNYINFDRLSDFSMYALLDCWLAFFWLALGRSCKRMLENFPGIFFLEVEFWLLSNVFPSLSSFFSVWIVFGCFFLPYVSDLFNDEYLCCIFWPIVFQKWFLALFFHNFKSISGLINYSAWLGLNWMFTSRCFQTLPAGFWRKIFARPFLSFCYRTLTSKVTSILSSFLSSFNCLDSEVKFVAKIRTIVEQEDTWASK